MMKIIKLDTRCRLWRAASYLLALLLLGAAYSHARAQAPAPPPLSPPPATSTASTTGVQAVKTSTENLYRIGPGDVLDIRVFNRPQLSRDSVRVDGRGMIRMPLIEGEIQAACRTENELAKEIFSRYLKYYKNPHVDVFVKDYQSAPVAIIGAVNSPGRFQLQRRVRLLELLSFANGPADRAGRTINVVHAGQVSGCNEVNQMEDASLSGFVAYSLNDTLQGEAKANPFVQPGDIITVPEADQIYVVGNVFKPSSIPLKEPITVTRAIAMAGGTMRDTKSDRIRIIRQLPNATTKNEIYVDLKAIEKKQAEDIVLQPNDIVDVPTSSGKAFLRSLLGAVVPSVAQMPVRVIP